MSVETGNVIANFNAAWPLKGDPKHEGDNHITLIKRILQSQFPGAGGNGYNIKITTTEVELNFSHGVKLPIQDQFDAINDKIGASGLAGQVELNESDIDNLEEAMIVVQADISSNKTDIGDNTTDINSLSTLVSSNSQSIGDNSSRITAVDNRTHIKVAGLFNGLTLGIIAGTGFSVIRTPGEPVGNYTISMTQAAVGEYVVTASSIGNTIVYEDSPSSFRIAVISAAQPQDPLDIQWIDPEQVNFIVVDA